MWNVHASPRRFRSPGWCNDTGSVRDIIDDTMRPAHFFVDPSIQLEWPDWVAEQIPWEIFNGRLLDPRQTREQRCFESRHVFRLGASGRSAEPLISVKYDANQARIHVTRGIDSIVTEGYDAGSNVFLTRETLRWVRELVGTIALNQFTDLTDVHDELTCLLFLAAVGTSRLPLTSIEAPLPEFSLGQLAYCYGANHDDSAPMSHYSELLHRAWHPHIARIERIKLLEMLVRSTAPAQLSAAAESLLQRLQTLGQPSELTALLRGIFQYVSLTPYTDFVTKALAFVEGLVAHGGLTLEEHVDFLSYVLRQLGRHLTAYDLVTFHHRGANYPDALMLDAVLKAYLGLIERQPALFMPAKADATTTQDRKRLRRRALRQGWYFREYYHGHSVPDAPTSPGENSRILPSPHERVPDEQILDTTRRTRRLFENDPLNVYFTDAGRACLQQSLSDLGQAQELRELGMAIFLERPLGRHKRPGKPDQTPLLSYEAFSLSIARRRLSQILKHPQARMDPAKYAKAQASLESLRINGVPVQPPPVDESPGRVSLSDAWRVATDFVLLRTTKRSAREFFALFNWSEMGAILPVGFEDHDWLILSGSVNNQVRLQTHDRSITLELDFDRTARFHVRAGVEYPAQLQVGVLAAK